MAKQGRHSRRKGPGGPSRPARSGRVAPVPAPTEPTGGVRFKGPTNEALVASLLAMVREAAPPAAAGRAIGVELWADHLGAVLYDRDAMPEEFYAELGEALAASPADDAPAVLAALAVALDHPDAKPLRAAQAAAAARRGPDDRSDLGIGRAVGTRALVVGHVQGDGVSIVVDFDQPGSPHSISAYVDHNLKGIARDLSVGPPWDAQESRDEMLSIPDMELTEISLADARARIADAMALTDHSPGAPVSDDYDSIAPIVARRVASLPDGGTVPPRPTVGEDELDEIVAGFLASSEVADLPAGTEDQAGWIAELWIDHAVNETVGGPLRVSEVLVELFCTVGFHATGADEAVVAAAPDVLAAWIRYASRVTGLRDAWRDEALEALEVYGPNLAHPPDDDDDLDFDDDRVHEALGDSSPIPPVDLGAWEPLLPPAPGPPAWGSDLSAVPPHLETRVMSLSPQAALLAETTLGRPFVQPAVDLVLALAAVDPSPLAGHRAATPWAQAAVWVLAEDSGAFADGRDPADLAAALGSRPTPLAEQASRLRAALALAPGARAVDWRA